MAASDLAGRALQLLTAAALVPAHVQTAHAFFGKCRTLAGQPCQISR